jgi:hypothetical protein
MNGGPSIIGMRVSEDMQQRAGLGIEHDAPRESHVEQWEQHWPVPSPHAFAHPEPEPAWRRTMPWVLGAFALLWVALLVALAWNRVSSTVEVAQIAAAALVGPMFAGVAWLLALRTSHAEAQRFGASARAMRLEAEALESTVSALGAVIDQQRAQLAEQVRMLATTGDAATTRLVAIGRGLSEEIDQADVHARALADAATQAQSSLSTLLNALPHAQAETVALTQSIEHAGLTAGERAAALDAQVAALTARGREAESVAGGAAEKLAAHIRRMEATSETAGARLESVTSDAAGAVDALLDRTATAIDESRKGIAAQGEAMLALIGTSQVALDQAARESAEALTQRIELVEMVIERIARRLDAQRGVGETLFTTLEDSLGRNERRIEALHLSGTERAQQLAASISALTSSAEAMGDALQSGDQLATRTIATTETLLTALDAATREIDETLPEAIDRLDARIAASQSVVVAARPELLALVTAAESTHDAIEAIAQVIAEQRRTVDALTGTLLDALSSGRAKADAIGHTVDEATERAHRLAEEAAPRLIEALMRVRDTAAAAADHARDTLAHVIPEAAEALQAASNDALHRAVTNGVEAQIAQVSAVAETAVEAAARATQRLEQQIAIIDAAAARVDTRLAEEQQQRDRVEQDSFARRASLLIEQLNSASIDLTRTLAPDVSDSAWAAYLKGDRGVFTRRAVRLLDAAEQRDIARLYDDEPAFRDQVNRYIHDFEAMLRTILTQRDSSPLGVTLLSSDMGKLYVALAQAIERLR